MEATAFGAAWPFLISGILACALSAAILTRRINPTTLFLSLGTLAMGMWSLMSGFHLFADDLAVKTVWVHGKYVFTAATPVLWLLTALAYAGSPLVRRTSFLAGLTIFPVATVLMVATNDWHGLMFSSVFPVEAPRFTTIGHTYGVAFWVYAMGAYCMVLAGIAVLVRTVVVRQGYVRRQSIMMTAAALVPVGFSIWFLANPSGNNYLDYTPVTFVFTNTAFAIAIFKYRMLSLMPVARREVIRLMDAPVIITDSDGYIEGANPAAHRVMGPNIGRRIGRPIADCIPELADLFEEIQASPNGPGLAAGDLGEARSGRRSSRLTGHYEREIRLEDDAGPTWYTATGQAFGDGTDSPSGFIVVMHDVTDLHDARERAEELSLLKSTFLSNMSHEIRTPLSAILGVSDLLLETTTDTDREMVGLIKESGERLLRMLNSVLSVSRMQSGTIDQHPESVEMVEIIRGVVAEYGELAADALLELETELPDDPVNACVDPLHVSHVLSHLLDNAIRYTESGSVVVRFEASEDEIILVVRDSGSGIPESFLPRVGTPFHQAISGDTRPVEGAGLGLAVVWGLVEVMGGNVKLDTSADRGSTFRVELPRWGGQVVVDALAEPMPARTSRDSSPRSSSSSRSKGSPIRSR